MRYALTLGLAILTVIAFGHVVLNDLVNLDDGIYVNMYVLQGLTPESIRWAWTTLTGGLYQPLTWMSLQLDAQVFGQDAWGFHLTNLLFHLANVLLVYFFLLRTTGAVWRSASVAALFAVHPMHVESVAWVTERKDVLVTFFWLLMLTAYAWYARRPRIARYFVVLLMFVAGLLSKAMIVTAPCLLLLLDFWPLRRARRHEVPGIAPRTVAWLVVEKAPLLAVGLAAAIITMRAVAFQTPLLTDVVSLSITNRLATALVAYYWYLQTTFWPLDLAAIYPTRPVDGAEALVASAVLISITLLLVLWARRNPAVLVGWLWFLGTLFPLALFAQAGITAWADRYAYVPHIGLFISLVWGLAPVLDRLRVPFAFRLAGGIAVVALLGTLTWQQVRLWRTTETLFLHTLRVTKDNAVAHHGLAGHYIGNDRLDEALHHYSRAVALAPGGTFCCQYAQALLQKQSVDEAIAVLRQGIALNPDHGDSRRALGFALASINELNESREHLHYYLLLCDMIPTMLADPRQRLQTWDLLADISLRAGEPMTAADYLVRALEIDPGSPSSHLLMGIALARLGRWDDAEKYLAHAKYLEPEDVFNRSYLAYAMGRTGKKEAADLEYAALCQDFPDWRSRIIENTMNRITKAKTRDIIAARELAVQACEATDYQDAAMLALLAAAQAASGDFAAARQTACVAVGLAPNADVRRQMEQRLLLYDRDRALEVEPK